MKVVFDINVLVSGILWRGICNELIKLAEEKLFILCFTPDLLSELKEVLHRPKFLPRIKILKTSVEEIITAVSQLVIFFPDMEISPVVKEDSDDDRILACAESSGVEYIITGDPHLLNLKSFQNIPIITPKKFLQLLKRNKPSLER